MCIRDRLKCDVCFEAYQEPPRFLQCHHFFCIPCLKKLIVHGNLPGASISCPTCRQVTLLRQGSVSTLQSNHQIDCLFQVRSMLQQASSTMCGKCEKGAATAFCHHCREFICKSCQDLHQKWKDLRTHDITTIDDDVHFLDALLAKQEDTVFSTIKQHLATIDDALKCCLLYTSPSPRDATLSRMPSSA